MGISSDARFLQVARKRFAHLFPLTPNRPGYVSGGSGSATRSSG
jgi:hypothetical protein